MNSKDIRFLNILSLRGPNLWTYHPVLEAWVDIGELEECPSHTIPGFVGRLCAWLPTLHEHRCSYGEAGGFVRRLHEGTWPAHILEHVTLELQNLAGMPGGFGKAREAGPRGVYKVVVRAPQEDVTRACLHAARELVMAAIQDTPFDVAATHERLRQVARQHALGPNTACIVDAATAKDRGIPAIRLSAESLVQLGYGACQHRVWTAATDHTGAIAQGIAENPALTRQLLASCGLPVADPDEEGFSGATRRCRLLVVGGAMVAAARAEAPAAEPLQAGNVTDVTDLVHPSTAAAACLAARVVGLNIAGVDVLAADISRPLATQQGAITAVHAGPGLLIHLQAASGETRPVGRAIVDHLFPNNRRGRIPVVGITGCGANGEIACFVAEFLRLGGKHTGLACRNGLFLDRRLVDAGDCANWQSGTRLLMNRAVEAAVVENNARTVLTEGLAYDRCQVGVVTRIVPERIYGDCYIEQPEQVFNIFRTQVDVVLPDGVAVLDATDPMVADMARLCDGEVMYFAVDPAAPALVGHLAHKGRAVFVRNDDVVLATGDDPTVVAPLANIPFLAADASAPRLESLLAAVATAWALGIELHVIRTGVETFLTPSGDPATPDSDSPALPTHA